MQRAFPILIVVVFVVSYFISDRIFLRAAQLSNNTMDPEIKPMGWVYAGVITLLFVVVYGLFLRDIRKDESEADS